MSMNSEPALTWAYVKRTAALISFAPRSLGIAELTPSCAIANTWSR